MKGMLAMVYYVYYSSPLYILIYPASNEPVCVSDDADDLKHR